LTFLFGYAILVYEKLSNQSMSRKKIRLKKKTAKQRGIKTKIKSNDK
jgi:hypothetical protein